jgi:hypothetical protein
VRGIRCHHQRATERQKGFKVMATTEHTHTASSVQATRDYEGRIDIDAATLEIIALFLAAGLLVSAFLVLYGPEVRGIELYGMVT